jgi:hypothetical protein
MAEQMASRAKIEFREEKALSDYFVLKAAKGAYISRPDKKYFKLEILAEPRWIKGPAGAEASEKIFRAAIDIASHVIHSYGFTDFDHVEIFDQGGARSLKVSKEALEKLRTKKIKYADIIK